LQNGEVLKYLLQVSADFFPVFSGKTPMETFRENLPLAKEKILDMENEDRLAIAA